LVPSLDDPKNPFSYAVVGDTIVGTWNIVNAKYLEWKQAGTIDENYQLTVKFDEKKKRFDFDEKKQSASSSAGVDDGTLHIGGEKSFFSGKSIGKSFSFETGGVYENKGKVAPYLAYTFETKRIKQPLFDLLKKNGWKVKEGLLAHLFSER
ncbi:MAG: hypothetical protein V4479_02940, partial [Actinomycetota bacterium]